MSFELIVLGVKERKTVPEDMVANVVRSLIEDYAVQVDVRKRKIYAIPHEFSSRSFTLKDAIDTIKFFAKEMSDTIDEIVACMKKIIELIDKIEDELADIEYTT